MSARHPLKTQSTLRGRARLHHLGRLSGRCVFVSDVHLKRPDDELSSSFLKFVTGLKGNVEHLFLVGDIFEFIDASSIFFRRLWDSVFSALQDLKANGCCIYFIEGNHDFGFCEGRSHRWWAEWADFAGDVCCAFLHESAGSVHVRHGDDIVASQAYLYFRACVKDTRIQQILRVIPGRLMHELCLWFAERSRRAGAYRPLEASVLKSSVQSYLRQESPGVPEALVLGHIHVFSDAFGLGSRLLSGPDWPSAPSFLALDEHGNWSRRFLQPDKVAPLFLSRLD